MPLSTSVRSHKNRFHGTSNFWTL